MLKANYHTHLALCGHAEGMSEDYVKEALKLNYKVLGISDHAFVPREFMSKKEYDENWLYESMTEDDFYNIYLKDIEFVQNKYSSIKIYKSLETEFLSKRKEHYKRLKNNVDYMILGIHFFEHNNNIQSVYKPMNNVLLNSYVKTAVDAMESNIFKIFAHPDIYMYEYQNKGKFIFDDYCIKAARILIESSIKNDIYLELNASGLFKGSRMVKNKLEYYYPRSEFWDIVKEYKNVKVVIGCDAHRPSELGGEHIIMAEQILKKRKIKYSTYIEI